MDWEPAVSHVVHVPDGAEHMPSLTPALTPSPPMVHSTHFVAVDTNVLIDHLQLVKTLHARLQRAQKGMILVSLQVVHELDGLKNKPLLARQASTATAWILEQTRSASSGTRVHCESRDERLASLLTYGESETRRPDDAVLSCCLYFAKSAVVTLWTGDTNLALLAEASGIPSLDGGLGELLGAVGLESGVNGEVEEGMEVDADVVEHDKANTIQHDSSMTISTNHPPHDERRTEAGPSTGATIDSFPTRSRHRHPVNTTRRVPRHTDNTLLALFTSILDFLKTHTGHDPPSTDTTDDSLAALYAHRPSQDAARQIGQLLAMLYRPGFERPLARAAGAAKTLERFLGPEPEVGSGRRRIRSGEAADALVVLVEELRGLGVPLELGTSLVEDVRGVA